MLENIVKYNLNYIVRELELKDDIEIDRIRYGIETIIGESLKLLIIFITSVFIGKQKEFFIVLIPLVTIRSAIGGSHSKSFIGCFFRTLTLFVSLYFLSEIIYIQSNFIEKIGIILIIFVLNTIKYKNKIYKDGLNKIRNTKLRIKLTFLAISFLVIIKLFFTELYTLIYITELFIILDYLKGEIKMKKSFKVSKLMAKYVGVMSLMVAVMSLNNYSFFTFGEPKLPIDIKNK